MQNNMVVRQGNGINVLINSNSNYGLNNYKPIEDKDNIWYKTKIKLEQELKENGYLTCDFLNGKHVKIEYEEAKKYIKCVGCAAEKINNYRKYCKLCPDYVEWSWEKGVDNAK